MLHNVSPACALVVAGAVDLEEAIFDFRNGCLLLFPIPLASNQREPDCYWFELPQSSLFPGSVLRPAKWTSVILYRGISSTSGRCAIIVAAISSLYNVEHDYWTNRASASSARSAQEWPGPPQLSHLRLAW
ncbi:hypothetical protein BT93_K0358 [Corymbia citriodora subsp. variegata]|nr:hypothetical protein BT93_K0358 [Corymbia citriodora subsp. variegata]